MRAVAVPSSTRSTGSKSVRQGSAIVSISGFKACGADGATVTTCAEFTAALAKARKQGKNFLIEAVVEQSDLVEPMVAPGAVLDDFVKHCL